MCFYIFPICVVVIGCVKIYIKLTTRWARSPTCLLGRTVIVTGSNTGIGFYTALDFAKRGAKVILACRDQPKAEEARLKIIQKTKNANVLVKHLDLASFQSVRDFAQDINSTEERLDILVNNAGVLGVGNAQTKDGHDLVIQVNHFSVFLLTHLLLDLLKKSGPSRVVNVSSRMAQLFFQFDLNKIDRYSSDYDMYCQSKVCNILFTRALAQRLEGTGVTTYSLHPGTIRTEIFRHTEGIVKVLLCHLLNFFFKDAEEGAQTTIYCAVEQGIEEYNGEHFEECARVAPYWTSKDPQMAQELWKMSEKVVFD